MVSQKLRVGVAGLGRMGKRHATNFQTMTPGAVVVAVSSPVEHERQWARDNLDDVEVYEDYEEMLAKADLHAVVVASATVAHAPQALGAVKKGLHVLCEKPLSHDLDVARSVIEAYKQSLKSHPEQKFMCAFSRRFDASYRDAYDKVAGNQYGQPVVFRSQTADRHDTTGAFLDYAKTSGGIFLDCSIHDIDLMLWFLGDDVRIKTVHAVGVRAVYPSLSERNDSDNAIAVIELYGGTLATLYCSRMMAAGQEDTTEVICKKGSVRVNMVGRKNHVEVHDSTGARRELPQHYYERFRDAFITESNEFTKCCLENRQLPVKLESSIKAVAIATALQKSLVSGEMITFDERNSKL